MFRAVPIKQRWRSQPPDTTRLDLAHPTGNGLIAVFLNGIITNPAATSAALSVVGEEIVVNKTGKAVQWVDPGVTFGEEAVIADSSQITTEFTIFVIRRPVDTTNRDSSLFGIRETTAPEERCGAHVPFSDGTIYFDCFGSGAGKRISWAGYSKSITTMDHFCFHGGPRGGAIWYNGIEQSSNTTDRGTRATSNTDTNFYINHGNTTAEDYQDTIEVNLVYLWNRQLADSEIVSLYANPWQLFAPRKVLSPSLLLGTSILVPTGPRRS